MGLQWDLRPKDLEQLVNWMPLKIITMALRRNYVLKKL